MDNFKMNIQLFAGEQTGGLDQPDQPDQPTSTKYVGQEAMEELVIKLKQYTDNKEIILDNTVTQNSSNGVKSSGIYSALQTKQDVINASSKLSSDFVDDTGATHKFVTTAEKNTWNSKQNALTFDSTPTLNSTNPVTSGGVYGALSGKQDVLTFDTAPTENSANPVTSGGLYTKFNLKADKTAAVGSFDLSIDNTTYVITLQAKDVNGNNLGTAKTIDLPLESVVVSGRYDNATKKVILTLKDGSTVDFSVADLISGLQEQLVSGTNIKTINGTSLLSGGDLDVHDIVELTGNTNIWELNPGIYKGKPNQLFYIPDTAIGFITEISLLLVAGTSSATVKDFVALYSDGMITGRASSVASSAYKFNKYYATLLVTGDVVNNLTSTSTLAPLSAYMGKTLKDTIDNMPDTAITTSEVDALFA